MPLSTGSTLGPYTILTLIGEGGMGEVYKARDTRLDRIVALKVSKQEFTERFEREARSVAALNHPNICQLYDVGPNYLVMEFIEGAPLKGPMPVEKAVEQGSQILDALDAAHRKRVVHRDLKPANILVTKQGIKLLDFGLAKQSAIIEDPDATIAAGLSKAGQIVGTLQYMAPEQLQGKEADARSDLFAFGCVLYELLSGKRAFEGTSAASVIAAILEREPARLERSPPLDRVIRRCLAKDPDARFQTAIDLKAALQWALQTESAAVKPQIRRPPWPWIAATAVLAFGFGSVIFTRKQPPDPKPIRFQILPPDDESSADAYPRISPDGTKIAFRSVRDGVSRLRLRSLDSMTSTVIPGTEAAQSAIWSPDSKHVAFQADGKLKKVDLASGSTQVLSDWPFSLSPFGSWCAKGYILISDSRGIAKVPQNGGTPELAAENKSQAAGNFGFPECFPDGERFLYYRSSGNAEARGVYAGSLDGRTATETHRIVASSSAAAAYIAPDGTARLVYQIDQTLRAQEVNPSTLLPRGDPLTLAPSNSPRADGPSVSRDGILVYQVGTADKRRLVWFSRNGTTDKEVGEKQMGDLDSYYDLQLAPDGRRAVVTVRKSSWVREVWVHDLERGSSFRFAPDQIRTEHGVWAPDGERIAIYSARPEGLGIYARASGGAGDEQLLTRVEGPAFPTSWSRDGFILFGVGLRRDIWVLDTREKKAGVLLGTEFAETQGQFSPDGWWVAYVSDESRTNQVYVRNFPKGDRKFMISTGSGVQPRWSRGGKELFYLTQDGKLMAAQVRSSGNQMDASEPRELFPSPTLRPSSFAHIYDVSPDGQRFLFIVDSEASKRDPINVVTNWTAGLR